SSRFLVELFVALSQAADRLTRLSRRLQVDRERMAANLERERPLWVAEPLYILLARHGHPEAHELARRLAARVREEGGDLRSEERRVGRECRTWRGPTQEHKHAKHG